METNKIPTVVVDDLHVNYRVVLGAGTSSPAGALRSLVRGKGPGQLVKSIHAVKGVSLVAYEGETIGLIGRNGTSNGYLQLRNAGSIAICHRCSTSA